MPARGVNLFNIAGVLFETRQQVWLKAINLPTTKKKHRKTAVLINTEKMNNRQTHKGIFCRVKGQVGLIVETQWI